jgi:hypothetical protein
VSYRILWAIAVLAMIVCAYVYEDAFFALAAVVAIGFYSVHAVLEIMYSHIVRR